MGRVIHISSARPPGDARYVAALAKTREVLKRLNDALFGSAVSLATAGTWRNWSDAQPVGSRFEFDAKQLLESGDARVADLTKLVMHVSEVLAEFDAGPIPDVSPIAGALDVTRFDGSHVGLHGAVLLCAAPGRRDRGRDIAADLRELRERHGAELLVSLITVEELELLGLTALQKHARATGMTTLWMPRSEGHVPTNVDAAIRLARLVVRQLRDGRTVCLHSRGARSRCTLVLASMLIVLGHRVEEAIELVRKVRPGAIARPEQLEFLGALEARMRLTHMQIEANS